MLNVVVLDKVEIVKFLGQKWTVWLRDIVIGGLLISAILFWQSLDMVERDGSVTAINTQLPSLKGESIPLFQDGKKTLVYFFAPWCQVCHLSIGNLEYLDQSKVNIVRIALDYESVGSVEEFANKHEIQSDILLGNSAIKDQFNVSAYPTYYLLDADRKIIGGSKGYSTAAGLKLREYLSSN